MPIVKRLVRPEPFEITTEDGYRYVWPKGGEALDVLDHHRRSLLAMKGAQLVDVEVVDPPVVLPAFQVGVPLELATVEPKARQADPDLTRVVVEPATVVPEPLTVETVPAAERPADPDLTGVQVEPAEQTEPAPLPVATVDAPAVKDAPAVAPVVGDLWSDADMDLLDRVGGR